MTAFQEAEEDPNRVGDIFSGFIDPTPDGEITPPGPSAAQKEEAKEDSDDDDDSEEDSGIDMAEVVRRFTEINDANIAVNKAIEKHGRASKQAEKAIAALAELFAPIKLTPKHFDVLVSDARAALDAIRAQERQIMVLMTRKSGMNRKEFIGGFPGNEVNNE